MRALPNMRVIVPSDAASTRWATRWAAEVYGPVYLRLSRDVYPDLYGEDMRFEPGRGAVVREGSDVTVIAAASSSTKHGMPRSALHREACPSCRGHVFREAH